MTVFVRVRSVDAPGVYMVARRRAVAHPDRYVIVDDPVATLAASAAMSIDDAEQIAERGVETFGVDVAGLLSN